METTLSFDPLGYDKASISQSLRRNFGGGRGQGRVYSHPFMDEITSYNSKTNEERWERFYRPDVNLSSLLDTTDRGIKEDNITVRMSNFQSLSDSLLGYHIQPIPEGQEVFECKLQDSKPFMFVVSNSTTDEYFDTVVIPNSEEFTPSQEPLYYYKTGYPSLPYEHSGDIIKYNVCTGINYLLHEVTLKSNFKSPRRSSSYEAVVAVHGYNKKSLLELKNCEPSICIVDYSGASPKIFVVHCPLIEDYVGFNNVGYLAVFEYFCESRRIRWKVLREPIFDNNCFDVGHSIALYGKGVNGCLERTKLMEKKKKEGSSFFKFMMKSVRLEEESVGEHTTEDVGGCESPVLIIQEPLLARWGSVVRRIMEKQPAFRKYTFHHAIKVLPDDDLRLYRSDVSVQEKENRCDLSLPIAGGSILSESPLLKLGLPPTSGTLARTFSSHLKHSSGAVVMVSDNYSTSNTPKVYSKLNACYVVVAETQERCSRKIREYLNSVNISMVLAHQGPLSVVVVYVPFEEKFYYFRGTWCDKSFAEEIEIEEIANYICPKRPLNVPTFVVNAEMCPIYDVEGREIFRVENNEEAAVTLYKIKEYVRDHLPRFVCLGEMKRKLKYVFCQLEVILDSSNFSTMMDIVVESVQQMTKADCLRAILARQKDIPECPTRDIEETLKSMTGDGGGGPYNKRWLVGFIARKKGLSHNAEICGTVAKTISLMLGVVKETETGGVSEALFELLNGCVSTRASYGVRERDLNKIIKRKKIRKNVATVQNTTSDELDHFLEERCSQQGVLIYRVDCDQLERCMGLMEKGADLVEGTERVLVVDSRIHHIGGDLASSLLAPDRERDHVLTFNYQYDNKMIVIPILDELVRVMKSSESILRFEWSKVVEGGPIEFVRILMRRSVYDLISDQYKERFEIKDPGHPMVGKVTLVVLASALKYLIGVPRSHTHLTEDCGLMERMRSIVGLMISIMASGTSQALSRAYQAVLYKNNFEAPKINFCQDEWLLTFLIESWTWLKLEGIDAKGNALACVRERLRCVMESVVAQVKPSERELELENASQMSTLPGWLYTRARPLVVAVLKENFPRVEEEDGKMLNYGKRNEDNRDAREVEGALREMAMDDVERTEKIFSDFCLKLDRQGERRERILMTYDDDENEAVLRILEEYKKTKDDEEDLKKSNKSSLFRHMERLKSVWMSPTSTGEEKRAVWIRVQSVAYDYFLRYSALLRPEVGTLVDFVSDIGAEEYSRMNEGEKEACLEVTRKLRYVVFSKALDWQHPYYSHTRFSDASALVALNRCKYLEDFIMLCTRRTTDSGFREVVANSGYGVGERAREIRQKKKCDRRNYKLTAEEKRIIKIFNVNGTLCNYAPGVNGHFMNWKYEENKMGLAQVKMELDNLKSERSELLYKRIDENVKLEKMSRWYKRMGGGDLFNVKSIVQKAVE